MDKLVDNKMINKIKKLLQEARTHVAVEVNNTLLRTYMEIGKLLVEDINLHENEENYQNKTISMLSKELTRKFGKGFSRANIWNMITFYKEYGSVQTLSERLSWSHEKAKASRLFTSAVDGGYIKVMDPDTAPRYKKYIPYWA